MAQTNIHGITYQEWLQAAGLGSSSEAPSSLDPKHVQWHAAWRAGVSPAIEAEAVVVSQEISAEQRIANAITIARNYAQFDGEHHKTWAIDMMVRALHGVRLDDQGKCIHWDDLEQAYDVNAEYSKFVRDYEEYDEGTGVRYIWDLGRAP